MEKRIRSSNIELLRIICMFLVVAHHCIIHGGGYSMENCMNKWLGLAFVPAGKICFDTFVAISAWFMVDSEFKSRRFVRIWFEVLFYNVVFLIIAVLLGGNYAATFTWRQFLGAFFPIIGNSHGFAAAYTAYCLIIPFLKMIGQHLTKKTAGFLVGMLILTQSLSQLFGNFIGYIQPLTSEILLFVMFYFIAFYLKRWPLKLQSCKPFLAAIIVAVWGGLCVVWYLRSIVPGDSLLGYIISISGSEFSINNIIAGFALFLLVKDIDIPYIPFINAIASTSLGILLYHDHNYFRPVLWQRIVKAPMWYYVSTPRFVLYLFAATIGVFVFGTVIDFIRQKLIEKPFVNSRLYTSICAKFDNIFILPEHVQ